MLRTFRHLTIHVRNNVTMSQSSTASSATQDLLVSAHGSARLVQLNRPKALNALNLPMVREFYPLLKQCNTSNDVGMVVVRGVGEKSFCAGGDVLAVTNSAKEEKAGRPCTVYQEFFKENYIMQHLIGTLSKPYVALIDGYIMGAGCGLGVNGTFSVATERTMFALPETALGFFPDGGASYFLPRLHDNLGIFLGLTSSRINGADCYRTGLATHYVLSKDLPALQEELFSLNDVSEQSISSTIRAYQPAEIPPFSLEKHLPRIRDVFGADSVEEIFSNLEHDGSEWALGQLKALRQLSPTSLKMTLRQLTSGRTMSLGEALTMEYRLSQRFLLDHDLHEGARAILVHKDRNPKWQPATVEEVEESTVVRYFSPLPDNRDLILP